MADDSLQNALSAKVEHSLTEEVGAAHEKYRKSGLVLSATISTLSAGALLVPVRYHDQTSLFVLYVLPLSMSLLHSLRDYLGGQKYARYLSHIAFASYLLNINRAKDADVEIKLARRYRKESDDIYGISDGRCVNMVYAFIGVTSIIICRLVFERFHWILNTCCLCG